MARRMFSPDIVESDAFLDMPISCQALYFHLGMNADDDGFVNPKRIMRLIGVADDDLKVLLTKRFLLPFESGVVVIKHWLIHNLIRADLYKETLYKKEKTLIGLNENGAYTEMRDGVIEIKPVEVPKWLRIRSGEKRHANGTQTALRIGKDRIGKDINIPQKINFEEFWKIYPNKVEKKKTEEKWERLPIETQKIIIADIPKRFKGEKWSKENGKFIEMPTTYINGERWTDEIKEVKEKIDPNRKQTFSGISSEIKL